MEQIDVDDPKNQVKIGSIEMSLIRQAEELQKVKAEKHIAQRRRTSVMLLGLVSLVVSIYFYTMYAMKQETFLDNFEMPEEADPLEEEEH